MRSSSTLKGLCQKGKREGGGARKETEGVECLGRTSSHEALLHCHLICTESVGGGSKKERGSAVGGGEEARHLSFLFAQRTGRIVLS